MIGPELSARIRSSGCAIGSQLTPVRAMLPTMRLPPAPVASPRPALPARPPPALPPVRPPPAAAPPPAAPAAPAPPWRAGAGLTTEAGTLGPHSRVGIGGS